MSSLDTFLHWCSSRAQLDLDHLHIQFDERFGYGLFPKRPIEKAETLILSIPEHLFIRPSNDSSTLNGFQQLMVQLLRTDRIRPYVEFLHTLDPRPLWRKQRDNTFYPRLIRQQMDQHRQKYQRYRADLMQYSDEQFEWAFYTIHTRSVHYQRTVSSSDPDDHLCLIPFFGRFPADLTSILSIVMIRFYQSFEYAQYCFSV
jgi:hypothetical protein